MKDRGWILPDVVDPPDSYTVCICIPNEIHYIAAFWGALQELAYQHNWQRDEAHTALPVSVKWNEILAQANERSNGMPLMCFTCEELEACITPLLEAQNAAFQAMLNNSKYGTDVSPGTPMTEAEKTTDLAAGTNPTCDLAILCGQAGQLIEYWVDTTLDILEKAEAATNTAEFADVITQITGLDEMSADVITGYITFVQESINEGYAAAVTIAYKESVKCSIWCKAKHNCEITPDLLYQVFRERIEAQLGSPLPAFASLVDLFQFFYGVPMDSTLIPDVMHLIIAGGGVLAQVFMGDVGVKPLQVLMAMWADEPDNDCELLCECPPECEFIVVADDDPDVSGGQDSGIAVTSGVAVTIFATGSWSYDGVNDWSAEGEPGTSGNPSAVLPSANLGQILWKVGLGGTWEAGDEAFTRTPSASGNLYFTMNDVIGDYAGNTGEMCITTE